MPNLSRLAAGLAVALLTLSSCTHTAGTPAVDARAQRADTKPVTDKFDPASECAASGGKYLGDMNASTRAAMFSRS
jgi:hypothetical protein